MAWLIYALISVLSISLFYIFTKSLLNDDDNDPKVFGGFLQITVSAIAFILILFSGNFRFEFTLLNTIILLVSGLIYTAALALFYTGLAKTDVSETTVLESTSIFWSMIFGLIFLSETLPRNNIIAALIIFVAVLVIGYNKDIYRFSKPRMLILIATIFYTLGATVDNYLIGFSNSLSYLGVSFLVAGTTSLLVFHTDVKQKAKVMFKNKRFVILLLASASSTAITYWSLFHAYELGGELSQVYPIYQLQTILVPILGVIILKERDRLGRKAIALVLTLLALYIAHLT